MADSRLEELIEKLRNPIPAEIRPRWEELLEKRDDEILTDEEYRELLTLSDLVEQCTVEWVLAGIEVAKVRQQSLEEVLAQFRQHDMVR